MKSRFTLLALVVLGALSAIAEETPEQIIPALQLAYDANAKAMNARDIEAFMELYADDYEGRMLPTPIDKEQVRELAIAEMNQARRGQDTYAVQRVEYVDVEIEGGKRRDVVATVSHTIVNEAIDREGKRVKKSLKVTYRDTVVKHGTKWQLRIRELQ